ncbi:hypothetical protein BDV32DRAFT_155025 [Aspergillus pseudonomiae]|nr:hypothetical protein BDV32DRAFT_155025 [Aspergillus pseudonomiae]
MAWKGHILTLADDKNVLFITVGIAFSHVGIVELIFARFFVPSELVLAMLKPRMPELS